jgi:hypothetical protein
MKQTRVPAQITTVEDKIAGNLNFTQILLLVAALFFATFTYLVLPTPLKFTLYKFPVIIITTIICLTLAIRIRGKVILNWLFLITAFILRPKYYVFNKNNMVLREEYPEETVKKAKVHIKQKIKVKEKQIKPSFSDVIAVERAFLDPNQNVRLAFRKGGIHATISESE